MLRVYFATSNKNKYEEAYRILETYGVQLELFSFEKIEIQAERLDQIALFAARQAYSVLRSPVLVEDSGLFIEELKGFPGPYSQYVFKTIGIEGILKLLEGVKNRKAWFEAAVACICPPYEKTFTDRVYGKISEEPRGKSGFGFDPIFVPEGETRTFAELGIEEKNKYSHRSRAFHRVGKWLKSFKNNHNGTR